MSKLNIQLCPETGICSILKGDGSKIDLMPDEVANLRDVATLPEAIKSALSKVDDSFELDAAQVAQLSERIK